VAQGKLSGNAMDAVNGKWIDANVLQSRRLLNWKQEVHFLCTCVFPDPILFFDVFSFFPPFHAFILGQLQEQK